jgi:hypothetical protein
MAGSSPTKEIWWIAEAKRAFLMILTPIPRERLGDVLGRFATGLTRGEARAALAVIRTSSAERAEGAEAERHRLRALDLARDRGLAVHPEGTECAYNWDGAALDGGVEAYVILHEVAHFLLAPPERRALPDFGLGPGPDTRDRDGAERVATVAALDREADEVAASLLGILWEAELGQPALASFLDQNWLEGLERSAAAHFSAVVERLVTLGLWSGK